MNYSHVGIIGKEVTLFTKRDITPGKMGGITLKLMTWNMKAFWSLYNKGLECKLISKVEYLKKKRVTHDT